MAGPHREAGTGGPGDTSPGAPRVSIGGRTGARVVVVIHPPGEHALAPHGLEEAEVVEDRDTGEGDAEEDERDDDGGQVPALPAVQGEHGEGDDPHDDRVFDPALGGAPERYAPTGGSEKFFHVISTLEPA